MTCSACSADTGFYSEKNVQACEAVSIDALIAVARDEPHPGWSERHSEPAALPESATAAQKTAHKLKTKGGRTMYALRKQTVEPVFGIIKSVMGFRQFSMRGLNKVRGDWSQVCMAWNLKRMAVLRPKFGMNGEITVKRGKTAQEAARPPIFLSNFTGASHLVCSRPTRC